jgi:hypothetical protein
MNPILEQASVIKILYKGKTVIVMVDEATGNGVEYEIGAECDISMRAMILMPIGRRLFSFTRDDFKIVVYDAMEGKKYFLDEVRTVGLDDINGMELKTRGSFLMRDLRLKTAMDFEFVQGYGEINVCRQ